MAVPCVDMKILAAMMSGDLEREEREQIMTHIQTCRDCFERVNSALLVFTDNDLNTYEPLTEKETVSMMKKIKRKARKPFFSKKRIKDGQGIMGALRKWGEGLLPDVELAYGYARNDAEAGSRVKTEYISEHLTFSDVDTTVLFEKYEDRFCIYIRMEDGCMDIKNIRFNLGGDDAQLSRLARDGHASFDDLPFGDYELTVLHKKTCKGTCRFKIDKRGLSYGENTLS